MTEPILYEQHMHTPMCKHASGMPTEYAARALEVGLKGIVVTCHNPLPDGLSSGVRMAENQWQEYQDLVAQTREEWADKVDVRLGIEADWLPGIENYVEKQLASAPLLSHLKEHPQEGDGQQHENPHCVHQFLCGDGHVRMLPVLAECSRDRI